MPEFLRRQLELGIEVSRQAEAVDDLVDAAEQSLRRDPSWIKYYQEGMGASATSTTGTLDSAEMKIAEAQVKFGHKLWARDYVRAAKQMEGALEHIFEATLSGGAWAALWLGYAFELMSDKDSARPLYRRAHSAAKNIPPLEIQPAASGQTHPFSAQTLEVAGYLDCRPQAVNQLLSKFDVDLAPLKSGACTVPQVEEAVRNLGEYLGLDSTRPDKEYGTGPDVLWQLQDAPALCMDVKSDKKGAHYWKKDVGQLPDHLQWVEATPRRLCWRLSDLSDRPRPILTRGLTCLCSNCPSSRY